MRALASEVGFRNMPAQELVPKGRLRVAQDVVLGRHENQEKSRRDG
jgi:hypothetical protein